MRKTILRKLGLGSCMLLTALSSMTFYPAPARASIVCETSDGIRTCTNTVTTEIVSVEQVGAPATRAQYQSNPQSLFLSGSNLGNNVGNLIGQGVSTNSIANTLASAGGLNQTQWRGILNTLGSAGNLNAQTAGSLINTVFAGQISPQLGRALAGVSGLGNIDSVAGLSNLLGNSSIRSALSGLTGQQAGAAIDQILQAGIGGALNASNIVGLLTPAGLGSLTSSIASAVPGLSSLLGGAGIQNALTGALGNIAGGALGGVASSILGGALSGGFGGALGSVTSFAFGNCCQICMIEIPKHHVRLRSEVTQQFEVLRRWMITQYFQENILPALMLMAEQLTVAGIYQVEIFGAFLDAKHQLETQRLFQQLTARAHKDYHPSEGMCTFGTTVRSLAMSDRRANMAQTAAAARMMHRQTLNGEQISYQGPDSDMRSRLATYIKTYCDQADNQNGLKFLCKDSVPDPERRNIDVDFTRNIESRLTLDMEFLNMENAGDGGPTKTVTPDEQDVFALASNLYAHNIAPPIEPEKLGYGPENQVRLSAAERYLDLRSVFAKRSVAQNSFAALVAMRTAGSPESAPYVKAVMRELGVSDDEEIEKLIGKNPSYFAQMEVLTKKLYQNPVFYTELYDKPVNIERKGAALQAIGLMQDRDLYNSLLRSEAVLSVLLETQLQVEQEKITNAQGRLNPAGGGK